MRGSPRAAMRASRGLALLCLGSLALVACSSDAEDLELVASGTPVPAISATTSPSSPGAVSVPDVDRGADAIIATSIESTIDVLAEPAGDLQQTVDAADVLTVPDQTPLTFLVVDRDDDWVEVLLPVRPNGTTGWVAADDVELITTDMRVEIQLDEFSMQVYAGDEQVLASQIGVGRSDRPTPGGVYYIRELLQPPDPGGVYGPYAYGLSGYSPVLDSFNGADAVIGIHGTDEPDSIGTLASSGCIRMPNDVITQLVTEVGLPLGTPVYISDADAAG